MKILILAFVAASVGLSECSDSFNFPRKSYTPKEVLEVFFNIKDKDLNEKCDKVDTDEKVRWYKIGKSVSDLQDAVLSPPKKGANKYQAQINVITTALPCASGARVAESLLFYKDPTKKGSVDISKKTYTAEEVLQVFFNIKDKDLNGKCDKVDTNEKARWEKIRKAISDLQNSLEAEKNEDPNKRKDMKDSERYKAQINVIKTALPCATDARVAESLSFYNLPENQ